MTYPLSPEAVAQMVADCEAGTPGRFTHLFGDTIVYTRDPNDGCRIQPMVRSIGANQWDLSRFARLPDLEAAYLTLAAENATLRAERAAEMVYALHFAWSLKNNAYPDSVEWEPLGDMIGLITQIDNMTAGVVADRDTLRASEAVALERVKRLEAALQFYADKKNWIDSPVWDGPDTATPKSVPMAWEDEGGRFCDCGDTARLALTPTADKEPKT